MAADGTVADKASHLIVVQYALKGILEHIKKTDGDEFSDVEAYLNIYPENELQFKAIIEACNEAGIEVELDTAGNRVRMTCGPRPGAPVTVWGQDQTQVSS